jgi:hypothetical protein
MSVNIEPHSSHSFLFNETEFYYVLGYNSIVFQRQTTMFSFRYSELKDLCAYVVKK